MNVILSGVWDALFNHLNATLLQINLFWLPRLVWICKYNMLLICNQFPDLCKVLLIRLLYLNCNTFAIHLQ